MRRSSLRWPRRVRQFRGRVVSLASTRSPESFSHLLKEEAEFCDTDDADDADDADDDSDEWLEIKLDVTRIPKNVFEIEIDSAKLEAIETLARSEGANVVELIHNWIDERLDEGDLLVRRTSVDIEQQMIATIQGHRVVLLSKRDDPQDAGRIVEPHVLHKTRGGELQVSVYQTEGYSESGGLPGWRNIALDDIRSLTVLDLTFEPRWAEGYKPDSKRRYHKVLARA